MVEVVAGTSASLCHFSFTGGQGAGKGPVGRRRQPRQGHRPPDDRIAQLGRRWDSRADYAHLLPACITHQAAHLTGNGHTLAHDSIEHRLDPTEVVAPLAPSRCEEAHSVAALAYRS